MYEKTADCYLDFRAELELTVKFLVQPGFDAGILEQHYLDTVYRPMSENTIRRLNKAIKEYCSEMGLDWPYRINSIV